MYSARPCIGEESAWWTEAVPVVQVLVVLDIRILDVRGYLSEHYNYLPWRAYSLLPRCRLGRTTRSMRTSRAICCTTLYGAERPTRILDSVSIARPMSCQGTCSSKYGRKRFSSRSRNCREIRSADLRRLLKPVLVTACLCQYSEDAAIGLTACGGWVFHCRNRTVRCAVRVNSNFSYMYTYSYDV